MQIKATAKGKAIRIIFLLIISLHTTGLIFNAQSKVWQYKKPVRIFHQIPWKCLFFLLKWIIDDIWLARHLVCETAVNFKFFIGKYPAAESNFQVLIEAMQLTCLGRVVHLQTTRSFLKYFLNCYLSHK